MHSHTQPNQDHGFSLEKYLAHVGLSNSLPSETSLSTLQTIIEHHLLTFQYQNTALYNAGKKPAPEREIPSLQINTLFEIMVKHNGGYCMQHLELISAALKEIGFTVDRHLAKVIFQPYSKFIEPNRPKTHELIIVYVNDKRYIIDVGMGDLCLRRPLELIEGEHTIHDDQYRLTKTNDVWTLDTKRANNSDWFCLYRFFNTPVSKPELDNAHTNLYLSPEKIRIRDEIFFAAQTTLEKRKSITLFTATNTGIFKSIKRNSNQEKIKKLSSFEEAYSLAEKKFGIK